MAINEVEAKWLFSSLQKINFFQSLTFENVDKIIGRIEKYSYPAEKTIIKEGQQGKALYIVFQGKVRITRKKGFFGSTHIADIPAGGFFGEISLVTDKPCTATVTACEPVELFVLLRDNFRDQLNGSPELLQEIKYVIEKREYEMGNK